MSELRKERVLRAARAIDDEQYFQRNGYMAPDCTFERPSDASLALAPVALLAAD